jgi:hypothetical protein
MPSHGNTRVVDPGAVGDSLGSEHPQHSASTAARGAQALDGEVIPPEKATVGWCGLTGEQAEELASRINAANAELLEGVRTTVAKAVALGKLLIEAKERIRHGAWLAWLERDTNISPRTAVNYMELARDFRGSGAENRNRFPIWASSARCASCVRREAV